MIAAGVAASALAAYRSLPKRGKPQGKEWTVLAAVVAARAAGVTGTDDGSGASAASGSAPAHGGSASSAAGGSGTTSRFETIALATGNKCCGKAMLREDGTILHDSHAEVLVRRALKHRLWNELRAAAGAGGGAESPGGGGAGSGAGAGAANTHPAGILEPVDGAAFRFRLQRGVSLYLYVSDSPCGDATIFADDFAASAAATGVAGSGTAAGRVGGAGSAAGGGGGTGAGAGASSGANQQFTGAKLPGVAWASTPEPGAQQLGVLRLKPGRRDLPEPQRTASMSCSDKIASWLALGLQGALLSHFVEPVPLAGVVVGAPAHVAAAASPPMLVALRRATVGRSPHSGAVCALSATGYAGFERSKSRMEREHLAERSQDQRRKRLAACGVSINAVFGPSGGPASVEVTIGARGQREGASVSNRKKRRRERKKERRRVQQRHGGGKEAGAGSGDGRGLAQARSAAAAAPPAPSADALALKFRSRLSRSALLEEGFIAVNSAAAARFGRPCACGPHATYREYKDAAAAYQARKQALLASGVFSKWVRG